MARFSRSVLIKLPVTTTSSTSSSEKVKGISKTLAEIKTNFFNIDFPIKLINTQGKTLGPSLRLYDELTSD